MTVLESNNNNLLDALYCKQNNCHFLHKQSYVEGVIYGACACPEIPLPDTWIPWSIKKHKSVQSNEQADEIFTNLFDAFRSVLGSMRDNSIVLPTYVDYSTSLENSEAEGFFKGLLTAHQALEGTWGKAWETMQTKSDDASAGLAKDLKHCLMMFSTFADVELALQNAKKAGNLAFIDNLPKISQSLTPAYQQYIKISGTLAGHLPEQFETYSQ